MTPVAVVTGAGSGLGRALSLRLAATHHVVVTDLDEVGAQNTLREIRRAGREGEARSLDVRDAEAWEMLREHVLGTHGGCDVLVNNAGVALGASIGDAALEDVHWVLETNLWGPIYGCHTFVPTMKTQGRGHIVNIASAAAFACPPGSGVYNVSKAGVVALSDTLRAELHDSAVGVTVVCPGFFSSGIGQAMRSVDPKIRALTLKLLERSRVNADDVAERVIAAIERGEAHVVIKLEGKLLFALRRAFPEWANRLGAFAQSRFHG